MTTIDLTNTDETPSAPAATPNDEQQQSDVLSGVRDDLLKYSAQGGFTLSAETHAWYAAVGTVATPEDARAASTVLAELRGRDLATVREAAGLLDAGTPLGGLDTVAAVAEAFALLLRVRETLATLTPAAYRSADLDRLSAATASGADRKAQGVKLSWGDRRALAKAARRLAVSKRTRRATLHSAINAAAADRAEWAALAPDTLPALPDDAAVLDSAAPSVETVRTGLAVLGKLLPESAESDLAELPFAELAELVDRLAADEGTLYRLPTLRALRDSIEERGHGDLLAELTEQQADTDTVTAACDRRFGPAEAEAEAPAEAEVEAEVVTTTVTTTATATDLLPAPRATDDATEASAEVEAEPEAEAVVEVAEVEVAEVEVEVAAEPEAAAAEVKAAETAPVEVEAVEAEAEVVEAVEVKAVEAEVEAVEAVEVEAPETLSVEAEAPAAEVADVVEAPEPVVAVSSEPEAVEPVAVKRPRKPSFTPGRPVTAYSAVELVSVVRWIDGDGTDRTEDELLRAAMKELGFSRLGPRIKDALGAAITAARA